MNLDTCFICKRPVLEFRSQFEKLDTYLLKESDEAYHTSKVPLAGATHAAYRLLIGERSGLIGAFSI